MLFLFVNLRKLVEAAALAGFDSNLTIFDRSLLTGRELGIGLQNFFAGLWLVDVFAPAAIPVEILAGPTDERAAELIRGDETCGRCSSPMRTGLIVQDIKLTVVAVLHFVP